VQRLDFKSSMDLQRIRTSILWPTRDVFCNVIVAVASVKVKTSPKSTFEGVAMRKGILPMPFTAMTCDSFPAMHRTLPTYTLASYRISWRERPPHRWIKEKDELC
jgi:hypothetical protein